MDAHVHLYPFMSVEAMLDAAERNLFDASVPAKAGMLLVADPEGVRGYERLAVENTGERWRREEVNGGSVTFRRQSGTAIGTTITILRGQQLITREGLEVLGTGYGGCLPSGLPVPRMVERIRAAGGVAILAWGVGKWLGRRGRVVADLIAGDGGPDVMLADNAGRPRFWRVPQFESAASRGMRVLAGTDPLPLPGEERRVGSYGFRITVRRANGEGPAEALWRALAASDVPVEIVGRRLPVRDFVGNQLRLRLARRAHGEVAVP